MSAGGGAIHSIQVPTSYSWTRPPPGWVKCNVDASFSMAENKVGIGICLRDDRVTL